MRTAESNRFSAVILKRMQGLFKNIDRTAVKLRIRALVKWIVRVCLFSVALITLAFIWLLINFTGETSTPSRRVVSSLDKFGVPRLQKDVQHTLDTFATVTTSSGDIPKHYWTESIRTFRPIRVQKRRDGLSIIVKENFKYRNGVIIYTTIPANVQTSAIGEAVAGGSGFGEYKLAEGVCWYWEKIREPRTRQLDPSRYREQNQEFNWAEYFSGTEGFFSNTTVPVRFHQYFQNYSTLPSPSPESQEYKN